MKIVTLGALALIGMGFALAPATAAPLSPIGSPEIMNVAADELSVLTDVGNKKWRGHRKRHFSRKRKRHRWHDDDDFNFSFGFGFPFASYGFNPYYRECIGWWHRHRYGRLHCHGQLVYDW
jgi:hypothetical protein